MTLASLAPVAGSPHALLFEMASASLAVVKHNAANPNPPTLAQARLMVKRGYQPGPAADVKARLIMEHEQHIAYWRSCSATDIKTFINAIGAPEATFRAVCAAEGLDPDAA